jgi:hydrogenase small subunit
MPKNSIYDYMKQKGVSRKDFLKLCGALAGALGLYGLHTILPDDQDGKDPIYHIASALEKQTRVPVIWLEFQDCAGCTEALTRSQSPTIVDLVLNMISIEYHETLTAAAGFQTEANKEEIMAQYYGEYVLVVEGSIPTGENGAYCTIGGRSAEDMLLEAAEGAAAIISAGNCAAFGGLPKADPNPTGAKGVWDIITDKPVINIPGCPAIPEVFSGTLAHYVLFGNLPELDNLNRPKTFYAQTVHDLCLRRGFHEEKKFAESFDDEGAKKGWCLYKLGCKGPTTYNACASIKWDDGLSFPVQSGHPCLGCAEPDFWDAEYFYQR